MKNVWWFNCGAAVGLTVLSIAFGSVPSKNQITDDTAIYQNLSEIRAQKQADLSFDSDIAQLARLERRYKEKLPSLAERPELKGPMKRISQQNYKYSGAKVPRTGKRAQVR